MSKRVSFHELAEIELNDAAIYFENEKEGLGFRFLAAMQTAVTHIQEHPQASPIIIEDIRRKVLRRFPYILIYSIKPDRNSNPRNCQPKAQTFLLARPRVKRSVDYLRKGAQS